MVKRKGIERTICDQTEGIIECNMMSLLDEYNISGATLTQATLSNADLTGALLKQTDLKDAIITPEQLNQART
jgi:uncharacterized protein YjbI with pentapeptide repeats